MPRLSPGTKRIAALGGVVVIGLAVVIAVWLWPDDRSRAVPVDEAVRSYRTSTVPDAVAPTTSARPPATTSAGPAPDSAVGAPGSTPAPTPSTAASDRPDVSDSTELSTVSNPTTLALPEAGVYRYATNGREDIDALDGAHHDYPAETTITVTPDGCGVHLRWDALRERREEWWLCATEQGIMIQPDAIQYHEFFQHPELERLQCDRGVVVIPPAVPPPEPAVQSCRLDEDPWTATWSVIERTSRIVEEADVPAWHVRMSVVDDDEFWEHTTIDWFLDDHGLPLAVIAVKESNSPSPVGDVRYRESYELSLISLTPLR